MASEVNEWHKFGRYEVALQRLMRYAYIVWTWDSILQDITEMQHLYETVHDSANTAGELAESYLAALMSFEAVLDDQIVRRSKFIQRIFPFRPDF